MSSKGPQNLSDQELSSSPPLPSPAHDEASAATEDWPEDALKMLVTVKLHENMRDNHIDSEGFAGSGGSNLGHQAMHQLAMVLPRLYPDLTQKQKPGAKFGDSEVWDKYETVRKAGKLRHYLESDSDKATAIMTKFYLEASGQIIFHHREG